MLRIFLFNGRLSYCHNFVFVEILLCSQMKSNLDEVYFLIDNFEKIIPNIHNQIVLELICGYNAYKNYNINYHIET